MSQNIEMNNKAYTEPNIIRIDLDNEISLSLESEPPVGPGDELSNITPDYLQINPFNSNMV